MYVVLGTIDRTYVRLSAPTFHCCMGNVRPLIGRPRNDRFLKADVVDTRYAGHQSLTQGPRHRTIWLVSTLVTGQGRGEGRLWRSPGDTERHPQYTVLLRYQALYFRAW